MGDSSRLYHILLSDKNDEENAARMARAGDFTLYSFRKLSKGIRQSFRKIKSLGNRMRGGGRGGGKTNVVADSGSKPNTITRDTDCESLDSGLESDESLELPPTSTSFRSTCSDKSVQTWRGDNELVSNVEIKRKSSNLSSRTADSGILSRQSPSCLVYRRVHNVPKKRVSILLPDENAYAPQWAGRSRLLDSARPELRPRPEGTVRAQRQDIIGRAKLALSRLHPDLCDTVYTIFQPEVRLDLLTAEEVGDLLFNLRTILYRSLQTVPYFETCLFVIQLFLLRVAQHLGLNPYAVKFRNLMKKSETLGYSGPDHILKETQNLYIQLWCSLLTLF